METRDELEAVLAKHQGHYRREIIRVLKVNGVDIRVYHNGIMDGNHCMKFAEKGDSIMNTMTMVALKHVTDTRLVALINKFDTEFKNILRLWFSCMRFLQRTGLKTDDEITSFKSERIELRTAIINICKDFEPLELPTTTKWHILMVIGCVFNLQLINWKIIGTAGEQNTETSHAEMNQLGRQCGNLRGASKTKLMVRAFVMNSIPFISEGMHNIVTKSSLPKRGKRTATASASNNDADINLEEEDDDILGGEGELSDIHRQMNGNGLLRGPSDVNDKLFDFFSKKDTNICFCVKCRKTPQRYCTRSRRAPECYVGETSARVEVED